MWPLFLIGGVVIVGGWLWGASKVVSKSPPLAHDTFTSSAKIQVGDIVEVALLSTELADTEQIVRVPGTGFPNLSGADFEKINSMETFAAAGGTGKFQITATGLKGSPNDIVTGSQSNVGQPISIGVSIEPAFSIRIPFTFLDASVRSVTRNGKQVG